MESDDDYQILSHPAEASSPVDGRKLKRLKKAYRVSNESLFHHTDQGHSASVFLSPNEEDSESSKIPDTGESVDLSGSALGTESFDFEKDSDPGLDPLFAYGDRLEPLPTPEVEEESQLSSLDATTNEFDGKGEDQTKDSGEASHREETGELNAEKYLNKQHNLEGSVEKKNKKRVKSRGDENIETSGWTKRRLEKERKARLEQLHAESQRLLRETRDAAFKPVVSVRKSISSVLEKIRKRKTEVSKKAGISNTFGFLDVSNSSLRECSLDTYPERIKSGNANPEKTGSSVHLLSVDYGFDGTNVDEFSGPAAQHEKFSSKSNMDTNMHHLNVDGSSDAIHVNGSINASAHSDRENVSSSMAQGSGSRDGFRYPVDGTQDLFSESQSAGEDHPESPEEVLAPSLLAMNLKLDFAPPDEVSDEEDDDKENIDPHPHKSSREVLSPKGDPVKAFVDDEAEEEDDSDHDLMRFQENEEDEENEGVEELHDLIVTGYKENPIDSERRDELHQKWLEQQDAAATDNVLQRLKFGRKQRDTVMLEDEEEREFGEGSIDEFEDDMLPTNITRINTKKVKQMIPWMFTDKDDVLSSDDEETEQRLVRQRLLEKNEDQGSFLSPAEDESSREVFGLIKKLNVAPDTKKKAKPTSFFNMLVTGGNSNSASKSSFVGRAPSNSLSSSHRHGSSTVRSFIFGRDDSNSRSGISTSEGSSDVSQKECRPVRNSSAKFRSSQSKSSSRDTRIAAAADSGSSLFDILKRSSMQSDPCSHNNVGQAPTFFTAFKSTKRAIKMEGRT
ncbi:PREDICTED: uncharacterized protein LOC104595738 [Nelumbo nucifera]|uniref:Uncharacterized protein n=2 Tax=Nelumbo nucifera TaxID=4432 RepID=A0A822ZCD1_NELNU|nr:PREDICTED: uncharacterized protein LOC104595738 [Nelumbo nucifera]DAD40676.1 TPA_asm: hypothetical protein HUJ06_014999 [Nelumbo nucifera]